VTRPDFLQPIIPTLTEDFSQCGAALGQMAQDFWVGPRKPCISGIKWQFFDETPEDKFEAETISLEYIFFLNFKINPLCVVLNHN
jgi:hypothetical protein